LNDFEQSVGKSSKVDWMLLEFRYEFGDRAQQPPEECLTPFGIEEYGPVAEG